MLHHCAGRYLSKEKEYVRYVTHSEKISISDCAFYFNFLTDYSCLYMFWLQKKNSIRLADVIE